MNLRALQMFVATADSGGLGRASTRLNLSQPAASRQIHSLETELGVSLFQRTGRTLQLTAEGEGLLRQARRLLGDADELKEQARQLKGGQTGTLRISATPQMIVSLLAPFLPRYRKRHPGIEVHLMEGSAMRQRTRLERGEIHLAIMPAGDGPFARRLLAPVHALAVHLKAHRLRRLPVIDVTDLLDEPLLLMQREFGSRAWFDAACAAAQVRPRVMLESTTATTLIELAAVGYGVAIVPSTSMIRNPALRAAPLTYRGSAIGQWSTVARDPRRATPRYVEQFVEELEQHAKRHFPGREYLRAAPPLPRPVLPLP
ncbi:MAG: hypothetical protein QOH67_244 [Hyphomicrobiales bacterium]|jgi:DNA-binding transcriptional LysR family regulator|nr:hypothetical protein [Hyphomicrobiales bacterium]